MTIPQPPRSVLVVDDLPDMSTSLALLLAGLGFSVRTALSGEQALRLIQDDPPDAVISDIEMPRIGGSHECGSGWWCVSSKDLRNGELAAREGSGQEVVVTDTVAKGVHVHDALRVAWEAKARSTVQRRKNEFVCGGRFRGAG